jgi:hypothetical protein
MRVVLRIVAVWLCVFVLVPFLFLSWHVAAIGRAREASAAVVCKAVAVVAVCCAFILVCVFAAHRLWGYRESGRRVGAAVFGVLLLASVFGALWSHSYLAVRGLAYTGIPLAILVSPSCRRACS